MKKLKIKDDKKQFKMYTQVHLVKTIYTRWSTKPKEHIRIHALSEEEKCVQVGKSRFWSKVFGPRYLVRGIWSKVFVLSGFGPRY